MHRSIAAVLLSATTALAQIPDGHIVVSSYYYTGGVGGLWVFDPRTPHTPRPITNLPPELVGDTSTIFTHGAACVKVLPDGRVAVGEQELDYTRQGELFVLTLNRLDVVGVERIPIGDGIHGTHSVAPGISEIVILPDGDLIVSGDSSRGDLFRVDLRARTATPIQVTGLPTPRVLGAIALDPSGRVLYLTEHIHNTIHRLPTTGGAAQLVGQADLHGVLAGEHDGNLLLNVIATPPRIDRMDPTTGLSTTVGFTGGNANALQVEPATGMIAYLTNGYNGPARQLRLMDPSTGVFTDLGVVPSGFVSGIDFARNPAVYGSGTPGQAEYGWYVGPGLGGLPRVGNAGFQVQVTATAAGVGGTLFGAAASADLALFGARVLLAPASLVTLGAIPASGVVSLPIPNVAALAGTQVFLQSAHLDAGAPQGIATSPGLRVSVLR